MKNKLLKEFLSYILTEKTLAQSTMLTFVDDKGKSQTKSAAVLSRYRKGSKGRETYDKWKAGQPQAMPAGTKPSADTDSAKEPATSDKKGMASRAIDTLKQTIGKISSGVTQLSKTFRSDVYKGGAAGIGTESSTQGESSSCAASEDFIGGRALSIGDNNHAVPANVTDEDIDAAKAKLRGKKGEPHDTRRAIEAAWIAKERARYMDAGGTPPENRWLRYAYRSGLSTREELDRRGADSVATSQAVADGIIPPPTVTGPEGKKQTVTYLEDLKSRPNISDEEKKYYERAIVALNKAEDTDTTVFYARKDGTVGVMFISNKQGPNDPHGNTTPDKRVRRIRESARSSGLPPEGAEKLEKAIDDARATIVAGGDITTTAKSHFEDMDADKKEKTSARLKEMFTNLPSGKDRADYTSQILEKMPVKKAMEALYCGENPNRCTKGKPTKAIPQEYQEQNVGRAFIQAVQDKPDNAYLKKILGKVGDSAQDSDKDMLGPIVEAGKTMRKAAKDAHGQLVSTVQEIDKEQCGGPCKDKEGKEINGPATQTYVDSFMRDNHWDQYICYSDDCSEQEAVSESKLVDIDGHKVTPAKFRECLGNLSGYKGDTESSDGQREMWGHLKRVLKTDPTDDSISIHGTDRGGPQIGKEKYRTKGERASLLTYLGKDMAGCVTGKS